MKYVSGRGEVLTTKQLTTKALARAMMPVDSTGYKLDVNVTGVKRVHIIDELPNNEAFEFTKELVNFDFWNDFEGMCIANDAEMIFLPSIKSAIICDNDYLLTENDMTLYRIKVKA